MKGEMVEWEDPVTGEIHKCPKSFMAVRHIIGYGEWSAMHAGMLLAKLGKPNTQPNQRHLRKAVFILRGQGEPIVSTRSKIGGYYIASTYEELDQHCTIQEKLAQSMLEGVMRLRSRWIKPTPPDNFPHQLRLL